MYSDTIKQATGCDAADAERIGDFMRDIIFHSTLDWQTREELAKAAQVAAAALGLQKPKRYRKRPPPKPALPGAQPPDILQP